MPTSESSAHAIVTAVAEGENLGRPVATYLPQRIHVGMLIFMFILALVGLPVAIGLYFFYLLYTTPNLNKRQAAKRLYFFERGLIVADAKGPVGIYRWENLTVLQSIIRRTNGLASNTTYTYTLVTPDGKTSKITQFYAKPEEWGPRIQNEITRAQVPGVIAALQAGANVAFGSMVINRAGLSTGKRSVRWDEVQAVKVDGGYLQIQRAGGWLQWSADEVSDIPNFFVFLTAVNQLRQTYPATT
jgi:hypothetical protein